MYIMKKNFITIGILSLAMMSDSLFFMFWCVLSVAIMHRKSLKAIIYGN